MQHLSSDHEDRPYEHENSRKLCDETSLIESQWKLRQQHDKSESQQSE